MCRALLLAAVVLPAPAPAQEAPTLRVGQIDWDGVINDVPGFPGVPLFQMPRLFVQMNLVSGLAAEGRDAAGLRVLDRLLRLYPFVADLHATRGLLLARQGEIEAALTALDTALELGYGNLGQIRRAPAFAALTANDRFRAIAAADRTAPPLLPRATRPSRVDSQTALVTRDNTAWEMRRGSLFVKFSFPEALGRRAPLGEGTARSPTQAALAARIRAGTAAGLAGVLYDNRDGDHSTLRREAYPQLAFVEYDRPSEVAGLNFGPNRALMFDAITFGNSSTALTGGPLWRSQSRALLTEERGPRRLAELFVSNHLYVYPEHRDYDPDGGDAGGHGDVFPANAPFVITSQGSSGTDQPILDAIAHILAAMSPELRADLAARRLIAPTVTMILRRGQRGMGSAEAYLSPAAHRPVIDGYALDVDAMIEHAARLTRDTAPPLAAIEPVVDFDASPGVDVFGDGLAEVLFDTRFARARIWRSADYSRAVVLRAGLGGYTGDETPVLHWRLLNGDPDKVRIVPFGVSGERARIEIDWHDRFAAAGREGMSSHRVDIGLIAQVGDEFSLPAMFSVAFPSNQRRVYERQRGGATALSEVDFAPQDPAYADPLIFPIRPWTDRRLYAADGGLDGWVRSYHDDTLPEQRYTGSGLLVRETDPRGRPMLLEAVDYPTRRAGDGTQVVDVVPNGTRFEVIYPSEEAEAGVLVPAGRQGLPDDAELGEGGADNAAD
ncbi:MAG: hypothetical protein AAF677_08525 [Pseudomonadota bacterium]